MRRFDFIRIFLIACILFSCSETEPTPDPELVISTDALVFPVGGSPQFFHIKSNNSWVVSGATDWLTVMPATGEGGTTKVVVTASENKTTEVRKATLTIAAGTLSEQLNITQSEASILQLSPNTFSLDAEGAEITIAITSSGDYTVVIEDPWIAAVDGSPGRFKVDPNPGLWSRSGSITFSLKDITQVVTINQEGNGLQIPADNTGMSSSAMLLSQKMKAGWNVGNSLEAVNINGDVVTPGETLWGNPKITKTLIDAVKAAGFKTVRIPCAWNGYIEDPGTYKLQDSWLARVKEVVDYCVDNDMYAIINTHWDGGWLEEHPLYAHQAEVSEKFQALWEQIAVYFRDYDEHLLFAGTNEVHADYGNPTSEHIEVQESYNQTFVDAVRSTGGKNAWRTLVVQAYNTNIGHAINYMTMPMDSPGITDRLMAEVHFYDPWDFAGDAASSKYLWGAAFVGSPHVSDWGQEAWVDDTFGSMKSKFVDNGIPVLLGEYGPTFRASLPNGLADHIAARNYYLNYVTHAAKENGLVPVYWDNGHTGNNGSGLFNRANGAQVYADAINAITSVFE